MARRPLRVTGFTRFVIVMIFVTPLAYLAASYYNGEDGIQNIKNLLGIGDHKENTTVSNEKNDEPTSYDLKTLRETNQRLQEELDIKTKRVDELSTENQELKRRLESMEKVVEELKNK